MSNVNKSRSNDIIILFIDLQITTEELNREIVHNVCGEGQGMIAGQLLLIFL